ncbi:MAG: hypothetical protein KKI08_23615 [Armatimonadetes bacterium]|nr:hypothetical protein [Armatimonadota bacterium]
MELVQIVRRIVDRQVRPAESGKATTDSGRSEAAAKGGGNRFLMRMAADGTVMRRGLYGRGRYGVERYLRG